MSKSKIIGLIILVVLCVVGIWFGIVGLSDKLTKKPIKVPDKSVVAIPRKATSPVRPEEPTVGASKSQPPQKKVVNVPVKIRLHDMEVLKGMAKTYDRINKLNIKNPLFDPKKKRKNTKNWTAAEYTGESFNGKTNSELIGLMKVGKKPTMKACLEIGDRSIAGKLKFTDEEKKKFDAVLRTWINDHIKTKDRQYSTVERNFERLWSASDDFVIELITDISYNIQEFMINHLPMICSRSVINKLIKKYSKCSPGQKNFIAFVLSRMKDIRRTSVVTRWQIKQEESAKLYDELIMPFLKKEGIEF